MKFETLQVAGFDPAFKGMRNPLNSWDRSDSVLHDDKVLLIGNNDMKLAKQLVKAGTEHCKFLRQIQVWVDVTAPRYWWQEADTYSFGTKNSCSTMHKLHDREFAFDDFQVTAKDNNSVVDVMGEIIFVLNELRESYIESKDYKYVIAMKKILPESYLQLRTWNTNYQELMNIYHQRKNHKLKEEWGAFCEWCESLPYFKELCVEV